MIKRCGIAAGAVVGAQAAYQAGLGRCPSSVALWKSIALTYERSGAIAKYAPFRPLWYAWWTHPAIRYLVCLCTLLQLCVCQLRASARCGCLCLRGGCGGGRSRAKLEQGRQKNLRSEQLWLAAVRMELRAGMPKAADALLAKALQVGRSCHTSGTSGTVLRNCGPALIALPAPV